MKKLFSLALIATSVALLSAVLLPAMASAADAPATFTPEQEAKIGKIAADYLVAHPEVLRARSFSRFSRNSRRARQLRP